MSILYQWSDRPLELLMTPDKSGISELDPTTAVDNSRTLFFNPNGRNAGQLNIIAVLWGRMEGQTVLGPVDGKVFQYLKDFAMLPTPTQAFFGFEGWKGKTPCAQVFYQYGVSGTIQCSSAWENGASTSLASQTASFDDPFRSGRLLQAIDGQATKKTGFRLKDPRSQKYLSYVPNSGLFANTADPSKASSFMLDSSSGRQLLACTDKKTYSYAYIGATDNGVDFATDTNKAAEAHYELPGSYATLFLILSFTFPKASSIPIVFSTYKTGDTLIRAIPIHQYKIDNVIVPTDTYIFQFEWATKVNASTAATGSCTKTHVVHRKALRQHDASPLAVTTGFPFGK